ncbi:hypothetical protein BS47DRAFT_1157130 [Hydnum rufescens UP504]|uniref:Uncharacterized protein n=1 Tax=Hydnum rufescens UP504 TaxID=1448309 RepID=A0A9P6BB41_9AGAM|nr:hypothetical protein BS47DRAFT_1157130 [Hydnum rufescens UP504]
MNYFLFWCTTSDTQYSQEYQTIALLVQHQPTCLPSPFIAITCLCVIPGYASCFWICQLTTNPELMLDISQANALWPLRYRMITATGGAFPIRVQRQVVPFAII